MNYSAVYTKRAETISWLIRQVKKLIGNYFGKHFVISLRISF